MRAVDNETDPLSVINLFKFEKTSKARKAEVAFAGTFSGTSENNIDFVDFSAEKYGKSSYLITVETLEAGSEYGLIVRNPNNLVEKS